MAELTNIIEGYRRSTSWRITYPLRAGARSVHWLGRNARRSLKLAFWLGTGQIGRATTASAPYRRRAREIGARFIPGIRPFPASEGTTTTGGPDPSREPAYAEWIARNDTLTGADRILIREHIETFEAGAAFSIVMPVYNRTPAFLRETIESVLAQLYENWQLCIAGDATASAETRAILEEYAARDARIQITFRAKNCGKSACSNTALAMATGDWIVLMDHDDTISEHALYLVAERLQQAPDAAILYSDEDRIDEKGQRFRHYFKPDWDYDLFLGQNLINHLGVYRADLARKIGGFREGFEGSLDWDFALRVLDAEPNARVEHIPFVLYHLRHSDTSCNEPHLLRPADTAKRAVNDHLTRTGKAASASFAEHSSHLRIKYDLPARRPLASIVIPTRDRADLLRTCIDGILSKTDYEPIEIVIVDNGSVEADAVSYLAELGTRPGIKVLHDAGDFNFSRLVNKGVAESAGEVCVLLNNDTDVISPGWLAELVSHALRPEIGAVGAKMLYPDGSLQHGGMILNLRDGATHVHRDATSDAAGYANRLHLTHNLSAVTGACLAIRRKVYDEVGGLNQEDLRVSFNDVDLCLKVRRAGYRVIWTPEAELLHLESVSRGLDSTWEQVARAKAEKAYFVHSWGTDIDNDPFFNSNLGLSHSDLTPDMQAQVYKPWLWFEFAPNGPLNKHITNALWSVANDKYAVYAKKLSKKVDHIELDALPITRTDNRNFDANIAIFTAISKSYDTVKIPGIIYDNIDYFIFSDSPMSGLGIYNINPITYHSNDPTRKARFIKTHPHFLLKEYDIAIWIDANVIINDDISHIINEFWESGKPVGALPHPMRTNVFEELDICESQGKDDPKVIDLQRKAYQKSLAAFPDLIESNLIAFNLRNKKTHDFLNRWWSEIDRFSKRDQLSLPMALHSTGAEWHPLMARPNSLRNGRKFIYLPHDGGSAPTLELERIVGAPPKDPFSGAPYSSVREERVEKYKEIRIDVILCVHNALEDVQLCLDAIEKNKKNPNLKLIIVDDGSAPETADFLATFADARLWVRLLRNDERRFYTAAANRGLATSTADFVILLNSDTIVTDCWTEKLADAVFSTAGAGIVGPMSNAASHQSIPDHLGTIHQTAVNNLPPGATQEEMNRYCEQWTPVDILPRVPLVHGFCFGITREALEKVGLFDEKAFPNGYGEENDYCFRATDAGFGLVVATHTYVFHAKSRSYATDDRVRLLGEGGRNLELLHGKDRIERAVLGMQSNPMLARLRAAASELYK